jgi:hypothetical protein
MVTRVTMTSAVFFLCSELDHVGFAGGG